jgi:hypothetical protein
LTEQNKTAQKSHAGWRGAALNKLLGAGNFTV